MSLRLIVLLGPRETVEAAELRMGALPHTLAMAMPFDSWNEVDGGNVLHVAMAKVADMFRAGIRRGEHLAEPEPFVIDAAPDGFPPLEPGAIELTTAQKNAAIERTMRVPAERRTGREDEGYGYGDMVDEVLRELLEPDEHERLMAAKDKAERIVNLLYETLVERRAA